MSDAVKIGLCVTGGVLVLAGVVAGVILAKHKKEVE